MKMHVLDLGQLTLDRNLMIGGANVATKSNPCAPNELIDIPVSSYCIEHPEGNILFDLGCNPRAMGPDGRWPTFLQELCPYRGGEECELPNRLAQLGLAPDDIRYAVLSHLHNDHAGCVEYFKKTTLIVHEDEFSGALRNFGLRKQQTPYVLADIESWTKQDLNWHLLSRDIPEVMLADGVEILNLGAGHAYGMLALHVQLRGEGSIILASDAIYQSGNYGPPVQMPGVVYDSLGAQRTIERVRALAHRHKAQVWFGHDPEQFATLRKSPHEWYE